MNSSPNYVRIFDTSLRDGEQAPGASMNTVRKARGRPRAGPAWRGHHRGRLSRRLARRPRGRPGHRCRNRPDADRRPPAVRAADHLWPGALHPHRHRGRLAGRQGRQASAHPYLPRDERPALGAQAPHVPRRDEGQGGRDGRLRAFALPGHRVFTGRCRSQRPALPVRSARGSHQGRRHHAQHPGHRRLHHARRVRCAHRRDHQEHARRQGRDHFRALPR